MTDETTTNARQDVQDLLDAIENAGWTVREYDADRLDPYEPTLLDVELEQREQVEQADLPNLLTGGTETRETDEVDLERRGGAGPAVLTVLASRDGEYDDGVPLHVVLEEVTAEGYDEDEVQDALDSLRQKGEVYEPAEDRLRAT